MFKQFVPIICRIFRIRIVHDIWRAVRGCNPSSVDEQSLVKCEKACTKLIRYYVQPKRKPLMLYLVPLNPQRTRERHYKSNCIPGEWTPNMYISNGSVDLKTTTEQNRNTMQKPQLKFCSRHLTRTC